MRIALFVFALLIGSSAAQAQEVLSANPRRIEIAASWCWWSSNCQLGASDIAQGICHSAYVGGPRRALYVRSEVAEAGPVQGRTVFVFKCDRQSIICQAGSCN